MYHKIFYGIFLFVLLLLAGIEIRRYSIEKKKLKLLRDFQDFLGEVRHYYYVCGIIDEAVYEALPSCTKEMEEEVTQIYNILVAPDWEEEILAYNDSDASRFFKTFAALCVTMQQYGDQKIDGESLFLTNTKHLKQELGIEILKWEKINHLFSGLMFLVLLPGIFLKVIEAWGVSNLPELASYYNGAFGLISLIFLFFVTLLCYVMIHELREKEQPLNKEHRFLKWLIQKEPAAFILEVRKERHYGKYLKRREELKRAGESLTPDQLLVKQIILATAVFLGAVLFSFSLHQTVGQQILTDTSDLKSFTSAASSEQLIKIQKVVQKYSKRYKNQNISKDRLKKEIEREGIVHQKELLTLTTDEIMKRIHAFQQEKIHLREVVLWFLFGAVAYEIPVWLMLYRKKVRQMGMEDEVIQFHSIILMLMYMEQMTVDIILEWMERFAILFRASLEECVNDFSSGEEEALEALKEQEPHPGFGRLVDNLLICDRIGIAAAFDEIAVEQNYYQEKRKQENEIYIGNKAIWGKIFAYLPLLVTMGFYLILPFVAESLSQLVSFTTQIDMM